MSFKERNKSLIDTLSTVILATLALLLSLRIFPLAVFLFPIPFVVLGVNYGMKNNVIGVIISSIAVGIALDIASGILILVMFLPFTIGLVTMIKKEYKPSKILLILTMILTVSTMILIFATTSILEVDFIEETSKVFTENFNREIDMLRDSGIGEEELAKVENTLDAALDSMLVNMPSVYIILSLIIAYINYLISTIVLRKDGYSLKYRPVFSEFRLPKTVFLGLMMMFILSYIFSKLNILNGQGVIRNLIVLVTFVFSLQGLSVFDYLMKARGMKVFGRVFFIAMLVIFLPIGSLMSFVGMLDVLIDFRRMKKMS